MDKLWEIASEIDSLTCRISNIKDILEIVAQDIEDPYSGALWSARDMLEDLSEKVDQQIHALMSLHVEVSQKKGKGK
jgi:archaellum component FlaC